MDQGYIQILNPSTNKPIWVRPDTGDSYVVKENKNNRHHGQGITYAKDQVWLDIGAHIGTYAVQVAPQVQWVHAYEPDPGNYAVLVANCQDLPNVTTYNEAVEGPGPDQRPFYVNTKRGTYSHGLYVGGGRQQITVPCKDLGTVIRETGANHVKIDAEGAELKALYGLTDSDWSLLEQLTFEYHFAVFRDWDHVWYEKLLERIASKGFTLLASHKVTKAWAGAVTAVRATQP